MVAAGFFLSHLGVGVGRDRLVWVPRTGPVQLSCGADVTAVGDRSGCDGGSNAVHREEGHTESEDEEGNDDPTLGLAWSFDAFGWLGLGTGGRRLSGFR